MCSSSKTWLWHVRVCACLCLCTMSTWCFIDPARGNTNIQHPSNTCERISETHKLRNIRQQGRAILSHNWCCWIDSDILRPYMECLLFGCIGRTRPFCLGNNLKAFSGEVHHILSQFWKKKGNVRERLKGDSVAELDGQTVSPFDRGYRCTLLSSFS